jgi:hypothetical protein
VEIVSPTLRVAKDGHPAPEKGSWTIMNEAKAILAIVGGIAMIVLGFTIKQFYAAKGMFGAALSNRKIATWQGRLLFLVIGVVMLLVGFKFFLFDQ